MSIAFFCRAKPQGCDAVEIFRCAGYVFIGYPLIRPGVDVDQIDYKNIKNVLVNPSREVTTEDEWQEIYLNYEREWFPRYTENRTFTSNIDEQLSNGQSVIVLIPRPTEGLAYLANLCGPFEIVNNPAWGQCYRRLRLDQNLDYRPSHILDVAQGWPVDGYIEVPYSKIPGWIRYSLTIPREFAYLNNNPLDDNSAYEFLQGLHDHPDQPIFNWDWTLDIEEIKRRLIDTLSPSSFENLVVNLLQLEHPEESWIHTGGTGDLGVDGYKRGPQNDAYTGLLQAKLATSEMPKFPPNNIQKFVAVLYPPSPDNNNDDITLLDLDWVAKAVRRHWRRLPLALGLRIGEPPDGMD